MNTKNRGFLFFTGALIIILALLGACSPPRASQPADSVTLQLNWLHYGAFGGFYAAEQNGDYANANLQVSFQEGGPAIDSTESVAAGDAHFGVASADTVLLARAEGRPVRAIATILQLSPKVIVAPADSDITRPADLTDMKIRMTTEIAPTFRAMMARAGIGPDQYSEVILPSDPTLFPDEEVPAWGVYYNSFAVVLQEMGHELNFIFPGDYGIHAYGDVIFSTDELIAENPELVSRFLQASLSGWQFAVADPDEIGSLVAVHAPAADPALESAKMQASVPLIHTGEHEIGWMEEERWQALHDTLLEQGVLAEPIEPENVFTMAFLHTIYGEPQ